MPNAIETVYLSLISFGNERAQVVSPFILICEFDPACLNTLAASGERLAGSGLKPLVSRANYEIQRTTPDLKGDWEATLFIFVGAPSSDSIDDLDVTLKPHFSFDKKDNANLRWLFTSNQKVASLFDSIFPSNFIINSADVMGSIDVIAHNLWMDMNDDGPLFG